MCHVTYVPNQDATRPRPPTSSRHYGVGPTTTVGADDPCHGASAAPECPRALPVTAGSDGKSRGRRLRVDAHDSSDPRHMAATVPWYLYGSDGHGAARVEDKADRARNGLFPESDRVCVICVGDLERIVVTREAASVDRQVFIFRIRE
jgi:hypothetical protein